MSNPNRTWRTLTEELEELERTDPEVAAAVARLDDLAWRRDFWRRANARRVAEGKQPIGPFVRRQRS